ncbi:hypothetical protein [Jeotgalibacillus marinus]|uniref:Uncharacterized protein n=1 Tax=Jeotgalibacillus marinus TaxID=86667 RepID=A0ABV3Q7M6_9BACL
MQNKLKPSKKFTRINHIMVNGTMVATGFDRRGGTIEVMPHAKYFNFNHTVKLKKKEWKIG